LNPPKNHLLELILYFCIATISLMEFAGRIFGEKLPPADIPNPMVQRRIIRYFTIAAKLKADDLKPESSNNPIQRINEDILHLAKGENAEFIQTLGKGGYDELSTHFFRDIVGKNSPLARSEERRIDDMQTIMADPILNSIGRAFETFYRHASQGNLNVDPELIEIAKQKTINLLMIKDHKHNRQFYEVKFRRFLYLHYGPAIVYSEQYKLLFEEAGIKFPRANRENHYKIEEEDPLKTGWENAGGHPQDNPQSDDYEDLWEELRKAEAAWKQQKRAEYNGNGQSSGNEQTNSHAGQDDWHGTRRPLVQQEITIHQYLTTLGLPKDTDVEHMPLDELETAVKKGYRPRAQKLHPDIANGNGESEEQRTKEMAALNNAHDALQAIIKERRQREGKLTS
jgi:hypothetical protein